MSASDSEASNPDDEKSPDCSDPAVVTKYQLAADIANKALALVIQHCKPGAHVVSLCETGDRYILEETGKLFKKGKTVKGIGFPTCISINEIAGHFSPLSADTTLVAEGDLVKIDLGVQIDGFVACVAHTVPCPANTPVEGRAADVLMAAYTASQAAIRLVKPGGQNGEITRFFQKCVETYKCNMVQGVLSHEVRQFVIDGNNCIIGVENPDSQVDDFEMQVNKAFVMDIVVSTGAGKVTERADKCTIYKRCVENNYQLKLKSSRSLLSQINKKYPTFPFALRCLEDPKAKLGIQECRAHDLVQSYAVLSEKKGELVAQIKFTCLLLPNGTLKITGLPIDLSKVNSEFKVTDEELIALLAQPFGKKKRRKKKKKKKKAPPPAET